MDSDFVISQTDGRPMYLQIMEQIKQRVASGDWQPEQKIPSIRELAISLKVSVITVKRAYLELEREGIIVTQHGKGSYISADTDLSIKLYQQELAQYLEEAVNRAYLLGLTFEELQAHLFELYEQITGEQT